jgi:hypothetical protein
VNAAELLGFRNRGSIEPAARHVVAVSATRHDVGVLRNVNTS